MNQYLLIPFLVGWTSIYQLFWCSPGVQGFDPSPFHNICSPIFGSISKLTLYCLSVERGLLPMTSFPDDWTIGANPNLWWNRKDSCRFSTQTITPWQIFGLVSTVTMWGGTLLCYAWAIRKFLRCLRSAQGFIRSSMVSGTGSAANMTNTTPKMITICAMVQKSEYHINPY